MFTPQQTVQLPELSFTVQPRPLRFLYCVETRRDFNDAVGFFTHAWGGGTNWILPVPAQLEHDAFTSAFDRFDPDYVILPKRDKGSLSLRNFVTLLQEKCPARIMMLGDDDARRFGALREKVGCRLVGRGSTKLGFVPVSSPQVSHRHQGGLKFEESRVVIPATGQMGTTLSLWPELPQPETNDQAFWNFLLLLKTGIPCPEYEEYLKRGLGAATLQPPKDYFEALKAELVCSAQATALSLSTAGCTLRGTNFSQETEAVTLSLDCLGIYLVSDWPENATQIQIDEWLRDQLPTLCSFWNSHAAGGRGIVLPFSEFRKQLTKTLTLCGEAYEDLQGVYLATNQDEVTCRQLYIEVESAIKKLLGDDGFVVVRRSGFDFPSQRLSAVCGIKTTLSAPLRQDNSLVFRPPVPSGLEKQDENMAFACDVEVRGKAGQRLALPDSPESCLSLSFSAETISSVERADQESVAESPKPQGGWRKNHLNSASVRPGWDSVTLITTCSHETLLFIPEEETLVRRYLEAETSIKLRPNRHTRYMLGVINRAGGTDKALGLVRSIGLPILKALSQVSASQCGLELPQVEEKTRNASPTESPAAKEAKELTKEQKKIAAQVERQKHRLAVQEILRGLIDKDLVRRGVALSCPLCDLKEWFAVSELREIVSCPGCGSQFPLPFESPSYFYKANELVVRCMTSGGGAVLETAAALRAVENAGNFMFGAELLSNDGQASNDVEIDLLWLVDETLVVAECKSFFRIGTAQLEELRESLPKAIRAASLLGARALIIGVSTTDTEWGALKAEIEAVKGEAERQQISVNLLVNSCFCLQEKEEPVRAWQVSLSDLVFPYATQQETANTFGEWPPQRWTRKEKGYREETINAWKKDAIIER